MTAAELKHILQSLLGLTAENEIVEFKEAKLLHRNKSSSKNRSKGRLI